MGIAVVALRGMGTIGKTKMKGSKTDSESVGRRKGEAQMDGDAPETIGMDRKDNQV